MEPAPKNVPLVDTPDADTLFEGQTWRLGGIDFLAVVSQNHNDHSFKNGWRPQSLSYIGIFLHCLPFKWFRIVLFRINVQGYEGGIYFSVDTIISTTLFGSMAINFHLLWMEEGVFLECHSP